MESSGRNHKKEKVSEMNQTQVGKKGIGRWLLFFTASSFAHHFLLPYFMDVPGFF